MACISLSTQFSLPFLDSVSSDFISSAVHAGIKFTSDFNDPEGREGVGNFHFHIKGESHINFYSR